MLGQELSAYLVYSCALDAVRAYGEKAAIDHGVIAQGGMVEGEGISDVEEIRSQVGAAKQAGLTRIHAYSLDRILSLEEQEPWYEAFRAPRKEPEKEDTVTLFRGALRFLDRLLR